jgi:molecular chaperone GrpE
MPPLQDEVGYKHPEEGQEIDPLTVMTADLQRLQAEYANYRKRVERDRAVASEIAIASVLNELLPLLDGLDRAAEHEELTGGFKAIDPQIHDALMHETSVDVLVPTASKILQSGYKFKERILRPASVAVTDPAGE